MSAPNLITLADYAADRQQVVLFWCSVGQPTGDYTAIGEPDLDFADRRGLLSLVGEIDPDGDWRWYCRADDNPTDDLGNTITKLHAYSDAKKYAALLAEFCG